MTTYIRMGNENGYEIVNGQRVEYRDEGLGGVPVFGWSCSYDEAKGAAAALGLKVDWASTADARLPSREGYQEAIVLCNLDTAGELVERVQAQIAAL